MLKKKISRLLNEVKGFIVTRKKEVCIGLAGLLVCGGIGFTVASMSTNTKGEGALEFTVDEEAKEDAEIAIKDETDVAVDETVGTDEVTTEEEVVAQDGGTEGAGQVAGNDTASKPNNGAVEKPSTDKPSTEKPSTGGTTSKPSGGNTSTSKPNTGGTTTNKPSGGGSTSKPNTGGSTTEKPSTEKPSTGGGTTEKPSKPSHSHDWVAVTEVVHHEEVGHWEDKVIKEAWTESIPIYEEQVRSICNACNADITGFAAAHVKEHMLNGEKGSHRTEYVDVQVGTNTVDHPAVIEKNWIIDKKAWSETVTKGHKCSCGATK